jgi:quercetin dioxygenase-like cupin family protein
MDNSFIYVEDLREHSKVPQDGILSRTLQNDDRSKIIAFGFAPGQELSAHAAPFPATLYFVSGEASVRLGDAEREAKPGTFVYMTPSLEHGIKAKTEVVMLLTMIKNAPATR